VHESNWTLHFSVIDISKKKYETRTDEWHIAWINPHVPSLGVDTERDFHPAVSSFHPTYKAHKIRFFVLLQDWHYSQNRSPEFINLAGENHFDICIPPHNSHKIQPLGKAFMGPLKISYS